MYILYYILAYIQQKEDVSLENLRIFVFPPLTKIQFGENRVYQASTLVSSCIMRYIAVQHIKIIEVQLTWYHRQHRIAMKHYEHYRLVEVGSNTPI